VKGVVAPVGNQEFAGVQLEAGHAPVYQERDEGLERAGFRIPLSVSVAALVAPARP